MMADRLPLVPPRLPELNLTGTRVAEYFRFACERQLHLELTPPSAREIPYQPRPGSRLLAAAGRRWERRKIAELLRRVGESRVIAGPGSAGEGFARLPAEEVVRALRSPGDVELLIQPELRLPDPARFAERYGLDPARVQIAAAVPDLLRVRRLRDGRRLFQIIDIKATARARVPHFAQVAYYALLLDELCAQEGIEAGRADRRWGRIWARDGRGPRRFPLDAYRHHVEEVLRRDLPRLAALALPECRWHVGPRCTGCGYLAHCRSEADRTDDLARVGGVTPRAKELLRARGVGTVKQLALNTRKGLLTGSYVLEGQTERLMKRANALLYGKVFDLAARTHLMPGYEDVRIVLSAESDPVSGRVFALGLRVESALPVQGARSAVWIAESGKPEAERAMLRSMLASLERVLGAAAASRDPLAGPRAGASVHFYVYDRAEAMGLRGLLLRHLEDADARPAIARLLRVFSPRAGAGGASGILRSAPGTVVADVVTALFALPVPYTYDLPAVSERLRPADGGSAWHPPADFVTPFSSQVAFERIHEVWRGWRGAVPTPGAKEVREEMLSQVAAKLAAVDSVVRAIRERAARLEKLQMRKEPFSLGAEESPLRDPDLEALRLFTELEAAAERAALQALHVQPALERARRFECIRSLSLVERRDDGLLVFEFDPACRDSKFRPGEFNLMLTPDDDQTLLRMDREPWKRRALMVELVEYDLESSPPRVVLAPGRGFAKAEAQKWIDLDFLCVLDRAPGDFSTNRLLATLAALDSGLGEAPGVLGMLKGAPPQGWLPRTGGAEKAFDSLLRPAAEVYGRAVLNAEQEEAWRSAFAKPLSLVWGPPGTGKTYLLAWTILGLAAEARASGRPCRILVSAATHRAVVNVLVKIAAERSAAGVALPLTVVKLRGSGSATDVDLEGTGVDLVADTDLPELLREADESATPLVVGSTVWSLWKQMRGAARAAGDPSVEAPPVASWFDVVVIDEASQMKVPEALIALSSMRKGARVILCGDDRQLAPVRHATQEEDGETLTGSAFGHFAAHTAPSVLRESRRMNAALVEYPRRLYYPGLYSARPERRLRVAPSMGEADPLIAARFLDPRDAVVLCTYRGVQATARNVFEAELAARIVRAAREILVDPETGGRYEDAAFVTEALGVVSPHRAQSSAILSELRRMGLGSAEIPVVDTVERMQGSEREMIVVSYAVADREYAEAEAEFLLNPNRFNVAVTRARAKLVVLVSDEVLEAVPTEESVMAGSMALKGYAAHCRDREAAFDLPGPDGGIVTLRCRYRSMRD